MKPSKTRVGGVLGYLAMILGGLLATLGTTTVASAVCGNGIIEPGENCDGNCPTGLNIRVAASSDDAEERSPRDSVSLTSSDLELVFDEKNQTVGMRFNNVTVPKGAIVLNAYVQFRTDDESSVTTRLMIQGAAIDNAPTFASTPGNISSRLRTVASVPWSPAAWTKAGEAGPNQRTPNIAPVIQEIVNRGGWQSRNSLVIIITGSGERVAESYDGDVYGAPLLHVDYETVPGSTGPTGCDDADICTTDTFRGSAYTCDALCINDPITRCLGGDGCCAPGCNANNDTDCPPVCGNRVLEPGETCDGNCPASCDDANACTTDVDSPH